MIPRPVSLHDQMAMSAVAYRKSAWFPSAWTYGMRTIVATDALCENYCQRDVDRRGGKGDDVKCLSTYPDQGNEPS